MLMFSLRVGWVLAAQPTLFLRTQARGVSALSRTSEAYRSDYRTGAELVLVTMAEILHVNNKYAKLHTTGQ